MDFLSTNGQKIYKELEKHCKERLKMIDVQSYELSMLANSFDLYAINAKFCRDNGTTQSPEKGGWDEIRPEYTVMKNEYQNILKHGGKFGLNPGDMDKIFKGVVPKKSKNIDMTQMRKAV